MLRLEPATGIWGLYPSVIAEYIKIPGYQEPHSPEEFNFIYFMRYRYRTDEAEPLPVKAIIVLQPGGGSGASSSYEIAAQIVEAAEGEVEFWTIDRREQGLKDTTGLKLAKYTRDAQIAYDYYLGPSARYVELKQEDVPFMAFWGLEVYIKDVEAVLDLIPKDHQATNVYLAGHSQAGEFVLAFAGYQFPDGEAGFEKVAGLIILDGGPNIIGDNKATLPKWQAAVQNILHGGSPVFRHQKGPIKGDREAQLKGLMKIWNPMGSLKGDVKEAMTGMMGFWNPNGESPYKYETFQAAGGQNAEDFLKKLRLTNEAFVNFEFDDDPIPGSMTQSVRMYTRGARSGRLDFPQLSKPGVPWELLDENRVYGWLSGGAGYPAGLTDDGTLNCYPKNQGPDFKTYPPNPNVTKAYTSCLSRFFDGEATNIKGPIKYHFPVSNEIEIYQGGCGSVLWYCSQRYNLDMTQARDMNAPQMNITRKADIDIPMIAYRCIPAHGMLTLEQFAAKTKVSDWTYIDWYGAQYSAEAKNLITFPVGTNCRLYNHCDILAADNSLGGKETPGAVGANVVTNTLVPWVLARAKGYTSVPRLKSLRI